MNFCATCSHDPNKDFLINDNSNLIRADMIF